MKKTACKICGSTEIKIDGDTVSCLSCGNKYTLPQKKSDKVHRVKIDKTDDAKNYLKRAQHFYIDGDMSECREYCDKILDIDATNIDAMFLLGKANFIYDYNQAEAHLKKVMFQDSKYFDKNIIEFINEIKHTIEKNATIEKQLDRIESFIRLLLFLKKHSDAIQVSGEFEYVYTFFDKHFSTEELNEVDEERFLDTMEKILSIITKEKSLSPKRQKLFMNVSCDFIADYIPGIYEMFARGYFHSPSERDFPNNKDGEALTEAVNAAIPYVNRLLECCPEADDDKKFEICGVMIEYLDLYIDATLKNQNKFFDWKDEHKEKYQKEMDRFQEIQGKLDVGKANEESAEEISEAEEQIEEGLNEQKTEKSDNASTNNESAESKILTKVKTFVANIQQKVQKKALKKTTNHSTKKRSKNKKKSLGIYVISGVTVLFMIIVILVISKCAHNNKTSPDMNTEQISSQNDSKTVPTAASIQMTWTQVKYENGQIKQEGALNANGQNEGIWKEYYENGQLKEERIYKDGKKEGLHKIYYENGRLKTEINYMDDKNEGPLKQYYTNGQLEAEGNFRNDKQDGLIKFYYENGQLKDERNWRDDKQDGPARQYYANGQLEAEGNFRNDKQDGIRKVYYENGQLKSDTNWKDGKQDGTAKFYYENGQLEEESTWIDGKQEGPVKQYYENGQLKSESNWKDGKQDGTTKLYYENGQLKEESNFKDLKQEGPVKQYYENGQLKSESNWKNNKQDGVIKFYYENGQLEEKGTWRNGKVEGSYKKYDKNGQLKAEEIYKDGKLLYIRANSP